jgi:hypothetical protein
MVELFKPSKPSPPTKILVQGLSAKACNEELLLLYFEKASGSDVAQVRLDAEKAEAIITFREPACKLYFIISCSFTVESVLTATCLKRPSVLCRPAVFLTLYNTFPIKTICPKRPVILIPRVTAQDRFDCILFL